VLVSLLSWKKIIKGIHITKIPNLSASVWRWFFFENEFIRHYYKVKGFLCLEEIVTIEHLLLQSASV
jgi:hypothetical protein